MGNSQSKPSEPLTRYSPDMKNIFKLDLAKPRSDSSAPKLKSLVDPMAYLNPKNDSHFDKLTLYNPQIVGEIREPAVTTTDTSRSSEPPLTEEQFEQQKLEQQEDDRQKREVQGLVKELGLVPYATVLTPVEFLNRKVLSKPIGVDAIQGLPSRIGEHTYHLSYINIKEKRIISKDDYDKAVSSKTPNVSCGTGACNLLLEAPTIARGCSPRGDIIVDRVWCRKDAFGLDGFRKPSPLPLIDIFPAFVKQKFFYKQRNQYAQRNIKTSKIFNILDLPPEIRYKIYSYLLPQGTGPLPKCPSFLREPEGATISTDHVWNGWAKTTVKIVHRVPHTPHDPPRVMLIHLRLACRFFYEDVSTWIYDTQAFYFRVPSDLIYFLKCLNNAPIPTNHNRRLNTICLDIGRNGWRRWRDAYGESPEHLAEDLKGIGMNKFNYHRDWRHYESNFTSQEWADAMTELLSSSYKIKTLVLQTDPKWLSALNLKQPISQALNLFRGKRRIENKVLLIGKRAHPSRHMEAWAVELVGPPMIEAGPKRKRKRATGLEGPPMIEEEVPKGKSKRT